MRRRRIRPSFEEGRRAACSNKAMSIRQEPKRKVTTRARKDLRVLVVDIGGTGLKILATGESERRRVPSGGKKLTPARMVAEVKKLAAGWSYDVVAIGYPGRVADGQPSVEPTNLGLGWVGFDYEAAFGCPVKIANDAALQALGAYRGKTLLFLGLGTGLGSAIVVGGGTVVPLELGHLSFKDGTVEDYVGRSAIQRLGKKKWRRYVAYWVERSIAAIDPDDVVVGGGRAKKLARLPPGCRLGANAYAFVGGFRLWGRAQHGERSDTPARSNGAAAMPLTNGSA
jgi:polyphosphate glucokinase